MKIMKKQITILMFALLLGAPMMYAEENNVTNECDTTYIKLDENREPINYVNWSKEDLEAKVGELETILETDAFQLYAAGDYTYKIENGYVTSMAIQIEDEKNDKVIYNQILNALAKSNSIKDTHNSGGNYYLPGAVRRLRRLREAHLLRPPSRHVIPARRSCHLDMLSPPVGPVISTKRKRMERSLSPAPPGWGFFY